MSRRSACCRQQNKCSALGGERVNGAPNSFLRQRVKRRTPKMMPTERVNARRERSAAFRSVQIGFLNTKSLARQGVKVCVQAFSRKAALLNPSSWLCGRQDHEVVGEDAEVTFPLPGRQRPR